MQISVFNTRIYPVTIFLTTLAGSIFSPVHAADKPFTQDFVITAYYSPLPDQCCYFRGSYGEEITFNGNGTNGADGTEVYPGMLAAPPAYAFGTRIALPGIGIGTVHDRGGRIIEWGDDAHRIDIWMGSGEAGLARALEWGVRRVRGTVYPLGTDAPAEKFSLDTFPSVTTHLGALMKTDDTLLMLGLTAGEQAYAVRVLQQNLKDLGYLNGGGTDLFGPATQDALKRFQADYSVKGDGLVIDDRTNAALIAARDMQNIRLPLLKAGLRRGSRGQDVMQAQKLMRYLGYYKGRTDGKYSDTLRDAVTEFQIAAGVLKNANSSGAGAIGPVTKEAVLQAWKRKQIVREAGHVQTRIKVAQSVRDGGLATKTLTKGDKGPAVLSVQRLLVDAGLLKGEEIGGYFGQKTHEAVIQYQIAKGIIAKATDKSAGVFGPATRKMMVKEAIERGIAKAREVGGAL